MSRVGNYMSRVGISMSRVDILIDLAKKTAVLCGSIIKTNKKRDGKTRSNIR